jgi:hypothetical protein
MPKQIEAAKVSWWAKLIYVVVKALTGGRIKVGGTEIVLPNRKHTPLGLRDR